MKTKLLSLILLLLTTLQVSAANENEPVSMVSYEQSWLDTHGALSLKNNTQEDIHNITFIIRYFEMDGTEIDYKEFTKYVDIAPGMTKKIEIEAFEFSRSYSYYESESKHHNPHQFTIAYELKSYNEAGSGIIPFLNSNTSLFGFDLSSILLISLIIGAYWLIGTMAKSRNRNATGFVLLALITTPFIAGIILLCVGKKKEI